MTKGTNPAGDGEIAPYDTASGSEIFSVGSINYPASIPVDDAVSHIAATRSRAFSYPEITLATRGKTPTFYINSGMR